MFEKFKKLNDGRVRVKVIATMLVMTLTFANFALLGSYMGKAISSYAADIDLSVQDNQTNIENVKFEAYLDVSDKSIKEKTADINSKDLILYLSVGVQSEGYLSDAKVEFKTANFDTSNIANQEALSIGTIQANKTKTLEIHLVAVKDSQYNLSLLNMVSQIRLTGEYIDNAGNVTNIDSTKMVKINWTTDEITSDDIELNQEIITNKIYNINGANKRIVQMLVTSKVKDNKAPIKSSTIEIANPAIGANPEEVKVAGYTTKATNGKTSLEFKDTITSDWEYNAEEQKTTIVVNNTQNEQNIVSWEKNCEDKYVVTYVYDESVNMLPFVCGAKATIELYGRTTDVTTLEKANELSLETLEELGDIAALDTTVTGKIYKGNMYIGEETSYQTKLDIYIPYSIAEGLIQIEDLGDQITGLENSPYYKTTKINKADAIKLLGTEGVIAIYDFTNTGDGELIKEILLSEATEEEYYTISYEAPTTKIGILFNSIQQEGTIEIINEKGIKIDNKETIPQITELTTNYGFLVEGALNNVIIDKSIQKKVQILEPTTTFDITLDKTSLSTQVENDLKITTELKAVDASNKLFDNPVIRIELPKEIKEASLENISDVLYDDELTLNAEKSKIVTNEAGNKELQIVLEGKQTKYNASMQNATIVADLKVKTDEFMASKDVVINATCVNGAENAENKENIKLVSKTGLITKNTLAMGTNITEKINQNSLSTTISEDANINISSSIINNFEENLSNINIVGKIPEETNLTSAVLTNTEGMAIAYSEEVNPTLDSTSWKTEVTDYSKIKSFKLTINEMTKGSLIDLKYELKVNVTNIQENTALANDLSVNYVINEQAKEEKIAFTLNVVKGQTDPDVPEIPDSIINTEKLSVQVISTVGGKEIANGAEVNNGQVIRYKVKVTNTSSEDLTNLKIKATINNGVFYELVEDGGTYYDGETDSMLPGHKYAEVNDVNYREISVEKLEAGKTKVFEYQTVAYIGEGENANQFKNEVLIIANNIDDVAISDKKSIVEGDIALRLHYSSNEEPILYSNGDVKTFAIELINLKQIEMKNIPIKISLPDKMYCDIDDQRYFDVSQASIGQENNDVIINVNTLEANESKTILINLKTKSIPLNEQLSEAKLVATVNYGGNLYTSNEYIKKIYQNETKLDAEFTSNKLGETLHISDEITYTLTLNNNGILDTETLYILDIIPDGLSVKSIIGLKSSGESKEYNINNEGNVEIEDSGIASGENLTLKIVAILDYIPDNANEITNKISIIGSKIDNMEESLVNKLENLTNPDNPSNPGTDPENPSEATKSTISGLAWLDENKDGIRNDLEKVLQGIEVVLLDKDGKQIQQQTTSLTGTYKFADIEEGTYTVAFKYDSSKYAVTKYQSTSATDTTNSDVISKEIEINGEKQLVGVTDTIKIDGKTINKNIDIGLIENAKFDLSLNKYITKVVLTNSSGTTTYEYEDTNLAKVEISAKKIAGTVLLVEYEIEVTNNGDVNGYVTDIIDYLPSELEFSSEMNTEWYLGSDNYLHYMALEPQAIESGKSQKVKLVLTKTLKSNSTGTIENIAEIGESTNLEGIKDIDSTAGNKQDSEDDIGKASLIVSIATGSPIMYIGIVIGSMLVLGLGIYIINKKVLKVRI